jgi:hypothetical protein
MTTNHARQIMLMVAELHRLGYEGLRLLSGLAPSGLYWRCSVLPVTRVSRENGIMAARGAAPYEVPRYSSGAEGAYFGWTDAAEDLPEALAQKFVARFPELAAEGKRADPEYVKWYREMLELTHPEGVIYAYADFELPPEGLGVGNVIGQVVVPLPPGGLA